MKLSVMERLLTQNLLPEKGSFTNLKLVRVARENLSFNEAENKALAFTQKGEQLAWTNDPNAKDKDIKVGEVVIEMVKKKLKELDEKEELTPDQMTLYEKFMG